MVVRVGDVVMLSQFAPYPRYGRVAAIADDGRARVTDVQCGDPRCESEHAHGDQSWPVAEVVDARAYQARAEWELGRKSSPNAPVIEE